MGSKSNFASVNPLHRHSLENPQEVMVEVSIQESNSNSSNEKDFRPATLPISSPFGPPGSSLRASNKNGVDGDSTNISSNSYPSLNTPKTTPIVSIKEWYITTYKCAKQMVNEKLGTCSRTVDSSLESDIDRLKDTQRRYNQILRTARDMSNTYASLVQQQILLYETFSDLALKEPKTIENANNSSVSDESNCSHSLPTEFQQNADMLRHVVKNGEKLIDALRFFCANLSTLVNKTIDDTMITIRSYEQARLEYDAEKNSVANLLPAQAASAANTEKLILARAKYERLREDVLIKIKFLEENKAKVMHKQMILFHNAFTAYASGNSAILDSTLKQFSIKPNQKSWLEK